jgi:Mo-co oxidoreductase dimerisation domain
MENTQKHYTGGEIKKARQSSSMGLIIRQKEPLNLETPFDQFDSFLTPTELFYIRSHFPAPKLDHGMPVRRALREMKLKSEIARPSVYATLAPNQVYTVFGAAWAGETEVAEIAVSTDGGQTWAEAEFLDPVQRYAWRRWKFDWLTPKKPGQYTLLARAKDAKGDAQPDKHDRNYGTYVINHPLPIEVFVAPGNGN